MSGSPEEVNKVLDVVNRTEYMRGYNARNEELKNDSARSMITEQIKQLRDEADEIMCNIDTDMTVTIAQAKLMIEAASTIKMLTAKVREDNAYQKAFEDTREELLYSMDVCEPGNPKQNNFVGGLQIAVEILNKHDPSKAGKETE